MNFINEQKLDYIFPRRRKDVHSHTTIQLIQFCNEEDGNENICFKLFIYNYSILLFHRLLNRPNIATFFIESILNVYYPLCERLRFVKPILSLLLHFNIFLLFIIHLMSFMSARMPLHICRYFLFFLLPQCAISLS